MKRLINDFGGSVILGGLLFSAVVFYGLWIWEVL